MLGLYRHAPGFEARMTRDSWLVASGEPHPLLNWITVIEPGSAAEAALHDHVASIRARGLPALLFLPPAAADAMASFCSSLGLVNPGPVPLMLCHLTDLAAPRPVADLTFEPVRDASTLRDALTIVAASFTMPAEPAVQASPAGVLDEPATLFTVAKRRDEIASVLATTRSGPLAYVDLMATAVNHKRQGIGYALLHHVLTAYAATGATDAFLISSDEGKSLYERLGFRQLFEATVWEVPATIATPAG